MTEEIRVPALGVGMSEGTLVAWLKADGERVVAGDLIYTLEGQKSVMEVEATASGTLRWPANR